MRTYGTLPKHQTKHRRNSNDPNRLIFREGEYQCPDDDEHSVPWCQRGLRSQSDPSHHHESTGPAAACALQGPAFLVRAAAKIGMARTAGVASGRLATIRLPNNVVPRPDSAAISIRRVARLSRNVGQPDHILESAYEAAIAKPLV